MALLNTAESDVDSIGILKRSVGAEIRILLVKPFSSCLIWNRISCIKEYNKFTHIQHCDIAGDRFQVANMYEFCYSKVYKLSRDLIPVEEFQLG